MINKVYVSTSNASLIQSAQAVAIASLGYLWSMGPVNEMRTVKVISSSKWAYMVLENGRIYTTNTGPNPSNKTAIIATSLTDITTAFAPTAPLMSPPPPPPFVLSFIALINDNSASTITATAPVTGALTGTHTYNGSGIVTGSWNFGDGSSTQIYTSSATVNHTFATGSWTASLALTESAYNSSSVAKVYVTANVPTVTPLFSVNTATDTAPYTASFTNSSSYNLGYGATASYKWVFGDGATTSSINSTHGYQTGSFIVQLQITESIYGIASAYILPGGITGSVPVLTPLFYVNPSSSTAPFTVSFANSSSANVGSGISFEYRWVYGDGTTSTQFQPPHGYNTGSFIVRLEISESAYNIATAYVLPGGITGSTPILIAGFITQSFGQGGAPESYMEPVTNSYTASGVTYTGVGGLTYNWDFGNGEISESNAGPIGNVMYASGAFTASLSITESSYNITSYFEQSFIVSS